jgi:hypothetical protein
MRPDGPLGLTSVLRNPLGKKDDMVVGAAGFEPATTCTPCKYATRLRHAPTNWFACLFDDATITNFG